MPVREIANTGFSYYLTVFDENGIERPEPDGRLLSDVVTERIADKTVPITDVFFTSHGWKGDVPAAIEQYDIWCNAMATVQADFVAARQRNPAFAPIIVGLHWPSLPWGDETIPSGGGAVLSPNNPLLAPVETQVDDYASRIADTPEARAAIRIILEAARAGVSPTPLPQSVRDAYGRLFAESGLQTHDPGGRPGADQDGFDPAVIIAEAVHDQAPPGAAPKLLGLVDDLRDAVLMPLRQLSFWKMKDRARRFGETGAHDLLVRLQTVAPTAHFHLMGHSFGCIVVSAAVAGRPDGPPLPRAARSLFLVQGALSLWSYADDIPYARGNAGYFHRIVNDGLVSGAIVTTRSKYDTAVGRYYPLGAQLEKQYLLAETYPKYGGIGSFGIQGSAATLDLPMRPANYDYGFKAGQIYNLEASEIIRNGGGASGAHSDIAHPEVAHAFWAAILGGHATGLGGLLGSVPGQAMPPPVVGGLLGVTPSPSSVLPDLVEGFFPPVRGAAAAPQTQTTDGSASPPKAQPRPVTPPYIRQQQQQQQKQQTAPQQQQQGDPDTFPYQRQQQQQQQQQEDPFQIQQQQQGDRNAFPYQRQQQQQQQRQIDPPPVSKQSPEQQQAADQQRWINAELEGHAPDRPLVRRQWYTLSFDVDLTPRKSAAGSMPLAEEQLFSQDDEEVLLTVQLDSADFEISVPTRPLRIARVGKSETRARFEISPLHDGLSSLKATIHKDGNFIQQMDLAFEVGAIGSTQVEVTARGRPPSAANVVRPRDVGLSMSQSDGGYDCVVWGAVSARARLPLQPGFLESAIEAARRELMNVVMHKDATGKYVFQTQLDIPGEDRDFALKTMARAGWLLFQKMFFGPAAGADSRAVGEFLRKMVTAPNTRLKLQIVAESAPVPWSLLYAGDASANAKLDWDNFIGMRHVIEQIPLQNVPTVSDCLIRSDNPHLAVSVNVNSGIDVQLGADFVAQQHVFWTNAVTARKRMGVTGRTTRQQVIDALASGTTDDQILYFYCHAQSKGLIANGSPDDSCLVLTDAQITLADLNIDAPTTIQLGGSPLVFINACESAEMSPTFYDGFVPYFMAKGARGVVGTECQTPALFAVAWAKRFFERFLDGEPLGETFLGLRREFVLQHGNPLGLLYAVHCDGDTQIDPALVAAA